MHASREDLYERDFYAWTRRQAGELRRWAATRPNLDLDKEQRNALRSCELKGTGELKGTL